MQYMIALLFVLPWVRLELPSPSTTGSAPRESIQENTLTGGSVIMDPLCQEAAFFISHKRVGVLESTHFPPAEGTEKTLDHLQQSPWPWEGRTSAYEFTIVLCADIPGTLYSKDLVDSAFYCGPPSTNVFCDGTSSIRTPGDLEH